MSAERERLSNADAAWLHMDRPTNLMVINSVLRFDEALDWERFEDVVRTRLVAPYPRFRQRVVDARVPLRGASWSLDPDFELSRHLHRRGLAAPGDETALKRLVGDLAAQPLDRGKPLWDMYLIDGPGRGCAVIVRMHHCIADGIALARVMLSLTDAAARPEPDGTSASTRARVAPSRPSAVRSVVATATAPLTGALAASEQAVSAGRRVARALARESLQTLASPRHGVELATGLSADAAALAKLLLSPADARSALKGDAGAARAVAWSRPIALERVKAIAHAQGATVNDVLLAAVSGALRAHLIACGESASELHALVPFNLRDAKESGPPQLGNRFGLVILTLPVDRSSRRERLEELKLRMGRIKESPEGPVSYAVLELLGATPLELESLGIDFFTAKATAVLTNVPGPRETVYLAGVPLRNVLVWAPTAGSVGMSVSILSYAGEVTIGLLVHAELVPDPQSIVDRLGRELTGLAGLAPAGGRR